LADLARTADKAVVITEGLLLYLTEKNVADLAGDLQRTAAVQWWLADYYDIAALGAEGDEWRRSMERSNAGLRFMPGDGPAFFPRHGWRMTDQKDLMAEAARLGRLPPDVPSAGTPPWATRGFWDGSRILRLERA